MQIKYVILRGEHLSCSYCTDGASLVAQPVKNPPTMQETQVPFPLKRDKLPTLVFLGSSGGSDSEESACNVGDPGSSPGLGRSPGEGNGNLLQYSCLRSPMGRQLDGL